jgi:hypothetical protein
LSLCLLQILGFLYSACLFAKLGSLERKKKKRDTQQMNISSNGKKTAPSNDGYSYHPVFSNGAEVNGGTNGAVNNARGPRSSAI